MPGGDSLTPFLTLCAARVFGKLSRLFLPCLSDGVMVTQRPLEALFMVRIHVGQPLLPKILGVFRRFAQSLHKESPAIPTSE